MKGKEVRSCPASLAAVPPQAHLAQLAFVKVLGCPGLLLCSFAGLPAVNCLGDVSGSVVGQGRDDSWRQRRGYC